MKIFWIAAGLLVVVLLTTQFVLSSQFSSRIAELGRRLIASQVTSVPDQALIPLVMREFATRNGGRLADRWAFT